MLMSQATVVRLPKALLSFRSNIESGTNSNLTRTEMTHSLIADTCLYLCPLIVMNVGRNKKCKNLGECGIQSRYCRSPETNRGIVHYGVPGLIDLHC